VPEAFEIVFSAVFVPDIVDAAYATGESHLMQQGVIHEGVANRCPRGRFGGCDGPLHSAGAHGAVLSHGLRTFRRFILSAPSFSLGLVQSSLPRFFSRFLTLVILLPLFNGIRQNSPCRPFILEVVGRTYTPLRSQVLHQLRRRVADVKRHGFSPRVFPSSTANMPCKPNSDFGAAAR
jgi:hypothetical protein